MRRGLLAVAWLSRDVLFGFHRFGVEESAGEDRESGRPGIALAMRLIACLSLVATAPWWHTESM